MRLKKRLKLRKREFKPSLNLKLLRLEPKIKSFKPNYWLKVSLRLRLARSLLKIKENLFWLSKKIKLLRRILKQLKLKDKQKENFQRCSV
jgi:hypothetical protein